MTNLSESERSQFYTELATATSPNTAEILVQRTLDVRWDELATKPDVAVLRGEFSLLKGDFAELKGEFAELRSDVAEIRSEMRVGFARVDARFTQVDARVETGFAVMNAKLERQLRLQLVWLIATLVAIAGMLIAFR